MNISNCLVVFSLAERQLALPLSAVERIVHAVEVSPVPQAPAIVLGVINFQGQIIPVLDVRERFRLPRREMDLNDRLIIAHTATRTVALVAEAVGGMVEYTENDMVAADRILPGLQYVQGVVKHDGELILICDLDRLLHQDEETTLNEIMIRP
ncbi:MAG: purine-binding chemotaxis protein CheW [Armatimonadetes bacterium]|nr:purine-binding chemotaxis protein CheW [Armatimonadota bacterium]